MRPKKLAQFCRAADAGPVVVVNVHKRRCDALVLMAGLDDVMHIPLDNFPYKTCQEPIFVESIVLVSGIHEM